MFHVRLPSVPFPRTVVNTRTGRRITYSDLSIHLIEAHTFYGLPASPYRLDPLDLIETLALA